MVKSFQGVISVAEKEKGVNQTVADHMTKNVITLNPDMSIYGAMQILLNNRISGAPVVDDNNELVGVLSEGDCLKEIVRGRYHNGLNITRTVGDHMTTDVTTISPTITILDAAHFFLAQRYRRFPVVENGKLIGLLTQTDLMKAVNGL